MVYKVTVYISRFWVKVAFFRNTIKLDTDMILLLKGFFLQYEFSL